VFHAYAQALVDFTREDLEVVDAAAWTRIKREFFDSDRDGGLLHKGNWIASRAIQQMRVDVRLVKQLRSLQHDVRFWLRLFGTTPGMGISIEVRGRIRVTLVHREVRHKSKSVIAGSLVVEGSTGRPFETVRCQALWMLGYVDPRRFRVCKHCDAPFFGGDQRMRSFCRPTCQDTFDKRVRRGKVH
jgi:hypothetical protein